MKLSKELITGIVAVLAIALLVMGVNFLKGSSFLGGDQVYYAYFPNSGGVAPATSVIVNGVSIGKVLNVELTEEKDSLRKVKMTFNIHDTNFKIPKGSQIEAGATDMFTKGLILHVHGSIENGYYKNGEELQGVVLTDITSQVKSYADPISQKLQKMMVSIDQMVSGVSSFWDTTASSELEQSIQQVKIAIRKFGNAASEIEGLVVSEKVKFSRIMNNVESITLNLKRSNDTVKAIIGDVKQITDKLVTSDFVAVIENAKITLSHINEVLESANNGEGTLGKLLSDDSLYKELIETNDEMQNLVNDLQVHPERYIHFSLFGAKTKGVPLTNQEEKQLRQLLDSIPN